MSQLGYLFDSGSTFRFFWDSLLTSFHLKFIHFISFLFVLPNIYRKSKRLVGSCTMVAFEKYMAFTYTINTWSMRCSCRCLTPFHTHAQSSTSPSKCPVLSVFIQRYFNESLCGNSIFANDSKLLLQMMIHPLTICLSLFFSHCCDRGGIASRFA